MFYLSEKEVFDLTQGERVKMIRKKLGMTLEKFGERIGVGKTAISLIESGKNSLTEANAKSICREFDVDYFWLTEGKGEMFIEKTDEIIGQVAEEYKLSDIDKAIVKAYVETNDEGREYIRNYFLKIAENLNTKKDSEK